MVYRTCSKHAVTLLRIIHSPDRDKTHTWGACPLDSFPQGYRQFDLDQARQIMYFMRVSGGYRGVSLPEAPLAPHCCIS